MLLTIYPFSIIFPPVWPAVNAVPVLLVLHILSVVSLAIRTSLLSFAVLLSVEPSTLVPTPVRPDAQSMALNLVVLELPVVLLSVTPTESAGAGPLSVLVITLILRSVCESFVTLSVFLVCHPLALVHALAISACELTCAHHLIVHPAPCVHVSISEDDTAVDAAATIDEMTFVQ